MATNPMKAGKRAAWISTQVAYGMDCSDPEPKNWKPFGYAYDQAVTANDKKKPESSNKTD